MLGVLLLGILIDLGSWMIFEHAFLRLGLLISIYFKEYLFKSWYQTIVIGSFLSLFYFILSGSPFWSLGFVYLFLVSLFFIGRFLHNYYLVVELFLGSFYLLFELFWWHRLFYRLNEINEFTFMFISVNLLVLCGMQGKLGNRLARCVKRKVRTPNRIDSL